MRDYVPLVQRRRCMSGQVQLDLPMLLEKFLFQALFHAQLTQNVLILDEVMIVYLVLPLSDNGSMMNISPRDIVPMKYKLTSSLTLILALGLNSLSFAETSDEFSDFLASKHKWNLLSGKSENNGISLNLGQLDEAKEVLNRKTPKDTIWDMHIRETNIFAVDCMKATGTENLCQCLNENLPLILSFLDYVRIVTNQKGIAFSGDFSADDIRKIIKITQDTRNHCVTEVR